MGVKNHASPGYSNITTATTTTVKSARGRLTGVTINGGTLGAITIYDNTAGSGTLIATIAAAGLAQGQFYPYVADFDTGLTVVTGAATDITVTFK